MDISRRTALTAGLTGAGVLALAACGSSGSDDSDTKAAPPADGDSTSAGSTAPGSPASSGATSEDSGGSNGDALMKLDDITVGEAKAATLNGKAVIVSRPTATTAACFSAICTHEGCQVAPAGTELHCPCHQSKFKASTGEVISGPAPRALDKVDVSVENGEVVATA